MPCPGGDPESARSSNLVGAAGGVRPASLDQPSKLTGWTNRTGPLTRDLADTMARALIVGLFLGLAYRIGQDVLEHGRLTGLLLLGSELLVVVLTLARRRAHDIDRSWRVRLLAAVSIIGPFLLKPTGGIDPFLEVYTVPVSIVGLAVVVAGKVALGRSFGLLPANRGVVSGGVYRAIRHPIYLGYVLTHGAFLVANLSWWNLVVLGAGDVALMARAVYEEKTLLRDPAYARYWQQVRWRVVPGVF